MTIVRPHLLLALALGMIASGLSTGFVFADEGHDHEAMKAEQKIADTLATLSPADRPQAEAQRFCAMMTYKRLGAMGTPIKLVVAGKPVFVCCKGCISGATKGGQETLKTAEKLKVASAALAKLPAKERAAAEAQKYCAIASNNFLGSMGVPVKMDFAGKPVYLCCKGCAGKAQANPAATLAKVEELKKAGKGTGHDHGDHQH
ncbi:MAG: hypothetical protein H6822_02045 [Planctomycetaceae bacterium]|nr:hypothetical protein [Planctomycetales bacterium]MCB9920931.1 hypothetical protein [Planctomycetaceae bacterium]